MTHAPPFPPTLPRRGMLGLLDRFIGPGATSGELMLQLVPPVGAAALAPALAASQGADFTRLQAISASVLAFDLVGGILTNATNTAKRWYHRAGQGPRAHATFVALHLAHLALVSWLYVAGDLTFFAGMAGTLVAGAAATLLVPLHLQRPVAFGAFTSALLLTLYALPSPLGLEWFAPLFFMKLLVSHLPRERAFAPGEGA